MLLYCFIYSARVRECDPLFYMFAGSFSDSPGLVYSDLAEYYQNPGLEDQYIDATEEFGNHIQDLIQWAFASQQYYLLLPVLASPSPFPVLACIPYILYISAWMM